MEVLDSRRLPGPNILSPKPGAVLDVRLDDGDDADALIDAWSRHARALLGAVGWGDEEVLHRRYAAGVALALTAPIDALYAATEVNEAAFAAASAELAGGDGRTSDGEVEELRRTIAEERNPAVLALRDAAIARGVGFLWDDDRVSVGLGKGSQTFDVGELPSPEAVPWSSLGNVPVALVTGTNGKTTTVRLLAAMARAAGLEPGLSSTDGCWVRGEEIGSGDYSGPGGARLVLRDPRVEVGLLETARGGMLRRGLGVDSADVALVTNVAEDHLGEWGIHDVEELLEAKMIVRRAARHLVLNADDPRVSARGAELDHPHTWFALDPASGPLADGADAFLRIRDRLVMRLGDGETTLATVDGVPVTLGGAAHHNVANALAACAVAHRLGFGLEAIRSGLQGFGASAAENPGRLNLFDLGGVRAIVDFAHNPHGLEALLGTARGLGPERLLVLVGQAGDRDDEAIRDLARQVWGFRPDRVIVKELGDHLRGRSPGEIPAILEEELRRGGAEPSQMERAPDELSAVRMALEWARPGDVLLLISHVARKQVLDLMGHLVEDGWIPGQALPELG
ncbi:MAG: Mur ligase family protein [Acidobacteriota bacterium]